MYVLLLATALSAEPVSADGPVALVPPEPSEFKPAESRFDKFVSSLSGTTKREAPALTRLAGSALLWGGLRTSAGTQLAQLQQTDATWRVYLRDELTLSAVPIIGAFSRLVEGQLSAVDQTAYSLALGAQLGGAALLAASLLRVDFAQQVGEGLQLTSMSVNANGYGATVRVGGTF